MNRRLDREKLEVYQASLEFIAWLEPILQRLPKGMAAADQLERASTSIPLNIAEGNGLGVGLRLGYRCKICDGPSARSAPRTHLREGEVLHCIANQFSEP